MLLLLIHDNDDGRLKFELKLISRLWPNELLFLDLLEIAPRLRRALTKLRMYIRSCLPLTDFVVRNRNLSDLPYLRRSEVNVKAAIWQWLLELYIANLQDEASNAATFRHLVTSFS